MLAKQKEAEYRDNQIGSDFTTCPDEAGSNVLMQLSGSTSQGKSYRPTTSPTPNCTPPSSSFLSYKITLPPKWKTELPEEVRHLDLTPAELT
jgi:hypothetical protein